MLPSQAKSVREVHKIINFHFLIRLNDNFTNRIQIIQTENKLKVLSTNNGKAEENNM